MNNKIYKKSNRSRYVFLHINPNISFFYSLFATPRIIKLSNKRKIYIYLTLVASILPILTICPLLSRHSWLFFIDNT